jgi:hypothetical protein
MFVRTIVAAALAVVAACHTRSVVTTTQPGPGRAVLHRDQARAMPPTIAISDDGRVRFVTPLRCAADVMVDLERVDTVTIEPNLAAFVVGVIVTAVGGIALTLGVTDDAPASAPATYLGVGAIAAGLPVALGPWFGNGVDDVAGATETVRTGATEEPCGEAPVVARTASLHAAGLQAFGAVDADGVFAVSPFSFVDAFAVGERPALDVTAHLVWADGFTTIEAVIDAADLARGRDGFFAGAGIDARVEPLRKVPRLAGGQVSVARLAGDDGGARLRIVVPVTNEGPGDAWQLRAVVAADHPELDGRILYIGHLPARRSIDAELVVPLSQAADAAIGAGAVRLEVLLRDAHGTAPASPLRFRGQVR